MDFKRQPYLLIIVIVVEYYFGIGMNDVVYIKSSTSASCHNTESCLTLSQFATNNSWLGQNTTVLLSASNHTLDLKINISNATNFSMLSRGARESKVFVTCHHNASLNLADVDQVWIRRLWFVGCGSNLFVSVKQLKVEDCTFQGQGDSGTALLIFNSNAIIQKAHFVSNTVGTCLFWLHKSTHVYGGGTVVLYLTNVTFLNCKFERNRAEVGGAIQANSASITVINSEFVQNHVTTLKRTMQCPGPEIEDKQCRGGAITMIYSLLVINNSKFCNNTNEYGNGGAMSITESDAITINSEFWSSNALFGLGGVLNAYLANVTVDNCTFYNSSSHQGGVMAVRQSYLTIRVSSFGNNKAKQIGRESSTIAEGGVIVGLHSHITLKGSQFRYNRAKLGAVLVTHRSVVTLEDCDLSENVGRAGGAMDIVQSNVIFRGSCYLTKKCGLNWCSIACNWWQYTGCIQ